MTLMALLIILIFFCFSENFRKANFDFGCLFAMFFILDLVITICVTALMKGG